MTWDQIETNWAAMTLRVRPDLLPVAANRRALPGNGSGPGGLDPDLALSDVAAPDSADPAAARTDPAPRPVA